MDRTHLSVLEREIAHLKSLADRAMAQLDDREFFTPLDSQSNSVANLVKHVAGNARSRWTELLTSDGEKPDRHRDREFGIGEDDTREALLEAWEDGWRRFRDALAPLSDADLARTVTIRTEPHTVLHAIVRQIGHYGQHVGQILMMAKHLRGTTWQTLSIPKGESQAWIGRARPHPGETV